MTEQTSRQVALLSVLTTCILVVTLILALGLDADAGTALGQALPLALIGGLGLVILVSDPFRER